ncbi:unnamed protein product, partial [Cladocopium goreaui]
DIVSCGSLVSACGKAGAWRIVMKLLGDEEQLNVLTFNASLSACGSATRWEEAVELCHGMPSVAQRPDVISFNGTISSLDGWPRALDVLALARAKCVRIDEVSCNGAISCEGPWTLALTLTTLMLSQLLMQTVVTFSGMLRAWAQRSEWTSALSSLQSMGATQVRSNIISHNNALYACRRTDQWIHALMILHRLMAWSVPSAISYSTTFTTLTGCPGGWRRALQLSTLVEHRLQGNDVFQNALGPASSGPWHYAVGSLWEMRSIECDPNLVSFNGALQSCAVSTARPWRQALELLSAESDVISFTSAAETCARCEWSCLRALVELLEGLAIEKKGFGAAQPIRFSGGDFT